MEFQSAIIKTENPYGKPGAHKRVMDVIENAWKAPIVRSNFVDMGKFDGQICFAEKS